MNRPNPTQLVSRYAGALLLASLTLAGCMPAHRSPPALAQVQAPQSWLTPHEGVTGDSHIDAQWWQFFGDAALNRHVQAALALNADLLAAGSRLEAARAQARLAKSALGPTLAASAGIQVQSAPGISGNDISRSIQPGLQAAWELDPEVER